MSEGQAHTIILRLPVSCRSMSCNIIRLAVVVDSIDYVRCLQHHISKSLLKLIWGQTILLATDAEKVGGKCPLAPAPARLTNRDSTWQTAVNM